MDPTQNDNQNKNKRSDPWTNSHNQSSGPPDLDEAFQKLQQSFKQFLKGRNGRSNNFSSNEGFPSGGTFLAGFFFILVIFLLWIVAGIFIVRPSEKAVVLRLGRYYQTLGPGPHWILRGIDNEQKINVKKIYSYDYHDQMLNKDENIVHVSMSVFYRIQKPDEYLFNVVDPARTLKQATASALRQVVGHTALDDVMTTGREKVGENVQALLTKILAQYKTGLVVTEINIQEVKAPAQVQAAFDDAIKAREDEQRYIEKAQAYTAGVLPIAEGKAQRLLEEANATKARIILKAEGEVARFIKLLPEYQSRPRVMKDRLYYDSLEEVLSKTTKVVLNPSKRGNNQMIYLPLDQLLKRNDRRHVKDDIDLSPSEEGLISRDAASDRHSKQYSSPFRRDVYQRPNRSH